MQNTYTLLKEISTELSDIQFRMGVLIPTFINEEDASGQRWEHTLKLIDRISRVEAIKFCYAYFDMGIIQSNNFLNNL